MTSTAACGVVNGMSCKVLTAIVVWSTAGVDC